ncbi:hypothetical protein SOVF_038200 [Spinacia oleracea]|uniref:Mitochondrial import receptor subunit TOM5 homolog n=1 Tax=Spinacia oleracea TaxID=3562 RepID=A0A9R0IXN3_SPIOL|nr:mitochondrial import receptor subunit TOM5 homolog [Spinacia oleracea]KNA21950.1 hypothetical protein SOVF_038200 [Spinacia oleracea]
MAELPISVDSLKRFWNAQVHDPNKWAFNMKFLRAAGMFAGSVIFIRNFGESVAL